MDAHYGRRPIPHKWPNGDPGQRVELTDPEEIAAYWRGYNNEDDRKNWW